MYLRASANSVMPIMTARLEAPPTQPWNFCRIMICSKLEYALAVGIE